MIKKQKNNAMEQNPKSPGYLKLAITSLWILLFASLALFAKIIIVVI